MRKTALIGMFLMATVVVAPARTEMSVQIREGQLRERPSFLGTIVATVDYGERVRVEQQQGPWRLVSVGEAQGWIHESALTRQRIQLAAGEEDVAGAATEQEMAMAGKGFNAEVEGEFRAQNEEIDFTWVDRMEGMGLAPERLAAFLSEGGVAPAEGDRE